MYHKYCCDKCYQSFQYEIDCVKHEEECDGKEKYYETNKNIENDLKFYKDQHNTLSELYLILKDYIKYLKKDLDSK